MAQSRMVVRRVYRKPPRIRKQVYDAPILGQKLPFTYQSEKDIWRLIRSRRNARLVRLVM